MGLSKDRAEEVGPDRGLSPADYALLNSGKFVLLPNDEQYRIYDEFRTRYAGDGLAQLTIAVFDTRTDYSKKLSEYRLALKHNRQDDEVRIESELKKMREEYLSPKEI